MRLRSGNKQLIREINQSLVLSLVRDHGPISRTEIAENTHLSMGAVSGITSGLIEQGLIYEHEAGVSTGGRRPILLALNRQAGLVLGVKLTERQIIAALTDLGAEVVEQRARPLGADRRPEAIVAAISELVDELRAAHPGKKIFGLGLGMAGVVDRRQGICRFSPFLQWHHVPLRHLIEQRLGLPTVIENDVNTLTMAEQWFGAGVGVSDFLVITLGRGIGMGMVLSGHLYRGGRGGGGEFGHLTMVPDGPKCDCGKRGCLETLVSASRLIGVLQPAYDGELTVERALELETAGDAGVRRVLSDAGRAVGRALADLCNNLNPEVVVIGGSLGASPALREAVRRAVDRYAQPDTAAALRVVPGLLGKRASVVGAVSLANAKVTA